MEMKTGPRLTNDISQPIWQILLGKCFRCFYGKEEKRDVCNAFRSISDKDEVIWITISFQVHGSLRLLFKNLEADSSYKRGHSINYVGTFRKIG